MQPEGTGARRRPSWQPSLRWGFRAIATATATVLLMALAAYVVGTEGFAEWDRWADLVLLVLTLMALGVATLRARAPGNRHMWLFVVFSGSVALSQLWLSLGTFDWLDERWLTPVDAGALVAYGAMIVFLVLHLRDGHHISGVLVYLLDAALITLAIIFVLWELVISPGIGDVNQLTAMSQLLVLLYPGLDVFIASLVMLMLMVDRSPSRIAYFCAMVVFAIADTVASATGGPDRLGPLAVASSAWIAGWVLFIGALAFPGGSRRAARRPTIRRLLVVYGTVTCAIWLATWRYLLHDVQPSRTTSMIGFLVGAFWMANQLAVHRQSSNWAAQLHDNIDELRRTQAELRQFLDDLPAALVVLSNDGAILELNVNTELLTGRTREQLLGQYFVTLFGADDRDRLVALWRSLRVGGPMATPTLTFQRPDGTAVLLEADANLPLRDHNQVVIALRDVTEREAEATRLAMARERFRLAFHGAPTGMALSTVPGGVLIDVNESLVHMLGRSRDDLIGRTVEDISHPDDWQRNASLFGRAADGDVDNYRMEKRYLRGDGGVVWARTWVSIMDDGEGASLAIAHIEDVTEQRHNAERLEWAAAHDGLTGLPNRFRFLERLGAYLEASAPGSIAVLFIDIDNFKVINDSLGHDAGDQLLQAMSERLRSVVRDRDMLGRFGGDEFIVMLRDVSGGYDPLEAAERLRAEIAQPLMIDGAELFVTASIGITVSDREGVTTTEMLRDADAAMYRAKARGRDRVEVFAPGSHDATVLTLRTTNELRRGLERGEIVPYYQPIVQLSNGHLMGFEVLARWRHPDRGLLGPDQFLPMAEETGLIGEVGATVLRASLVQLGQWRNATQRFNDLSVSVNVSVRQLMSSQLVDVVADALAEAGVSASALWLEITETALMADVKAATVALRELRSLGLHLAVDDFGTGYSSLTYLKRFPVEAIKVDRTFVNGLGIDAEDSTIVEAVVNLGHSLGLSVVAEGVETPLQLSRLREIGCDRGQGYLFGRPRPAELIEAEYSLV